MKQLHENNFSFLLLIFLVLSCAATATADMILDIDFSGKSSQSSANCYGGMIDAGSSGSRLYVYKWPCRQKATFPQIDISQVAPNRRVTPGISSFANNIAGMEAYLNPLFTFAKQNIPSSVNISSVPFFLRATAGMRLLTVEQQAKILNETVRVMQHSGFFVQNDSFVSVISGEQEGAYGFVALNYLNGKFQSVLTNPSEKMTPISDLGGASVQLTFEPTTVNSFENSYNLTIRGLKSFILYTYSYLNYGNDQARNRVMQLSPINSQNEMLYPCYLQGYNASNSFANPSQLVVGTGNVVECVALIDQFLNLNTTGASVNGNPQPPILLDEILYATNSYRFAAEFFGYNGGNVTMEQLFQTTSQYCVQDYATAYFNSKNSSFAYSYCFLGLYASRLLEKGFGYPGNRTVNIVPSIQNNDVTYALGAMIHDVALLPCEMEGCGRIITPTSSTVISNGTRLQICNGLHTILLFIFIIVLLE